MIEKRKGVDRTAPAPDKDKRVQPTLYIGIGGTGKEIMLRLRRRILQALWNGKRVESMDDFPVASFLYFDTYTGAAEDDQRQSEEGMKADPLRALTKLPGSDCLQRAFKTDKYLQGEELQVYPHIKKWLPAGDLQAIPPGEGAGQVRAISRLFFFDQVQPLNNIIQKKALELTQNLDDRRLKNLGLEIEPKVRIVVLCSIAGGTGSGAFLDMGYLCSSLIHPELERVILYAITGSAYSGQNKRVLANSYAALAELEYCMSGSQHSYVEQWDKSLANRAPKPFSKIFIVDNTNLTKQSTKDRGHLFGMIADSLFEELHDPELRGKRAEDLSNQSQHKIELYIPDGTESLGLHSQRFSRAYSAFGQVTLFTEGRTQFERETAELARDMIKAFFGMTEQDRANQPTGPEVEDFLAGQLHLKASYYQNFPDWLPENQKRSLDDYPIVDELLKQGELSLDQKLADHIREGFVALRESGRDLSEWRRHAELIRQQREQEIEGAIDSSQRGATYPRILEERREHLMAGLNSSLREALYARLDNRERGGLTYTISLIGEIRDALQGERTGVCTRLEQAARQLDQLADDLRDGFYTRALANLEKAASKGMLRGPDREASLRCLGQAEEATSYYLRYRLRALACRQAIRLLREKVIPELGQPSALGEETNTGATGIVAEFERGRSAVRQALEELEAEISILKDVASSQSPLRASIPGGHLSMEVSVDRGRLTELGVDALSGYGGSRELFQQLRDDAKRPLIISNLRGKARENMRERESRLPTVLEALQAIKIPEQRARLFREAFNNAMPWANCDRSRDNEYDPTMITTFLAVENVREFMGVFEDEIRPALPVGLTKDIYQVASAERGRLVIYTEYTGMPINVLIGMHDSWRQEYQQLMTGSKRLPLHNHQRTERFRRPTAMTQQELGQLHEQLKLYLQGVGFGLLRRDDRREVYKLNVSRGHVPDWQSIGREQQFYLTGLPDAKAEVLRRQIRELERDMTPRQKLLAAALFSYIANWSYAPILVEKRQGDDIRHGGIAHHAALALSEAYRKQYEATPEGRSSAENTNRMLVALDQNIGDWSTEISGSLDDTTAQETNLEPAENDLDNKAQPKRAIANILSIRDEEIDRWASIGGAHEGSGVAPNIPNHNGKQSPAPPALPVFDYFLAANGQPQGPFKLDALPAKCRSGELTSETLVWREELVNWVKAGQLPELQHLFVRREPPPIPTA